MYKIFILFFLFVIIVVFLLSCIFKVDVLCFDEGEFVMVNDYVLVKVMEVKSMRYFVR